MPATALASFILIVLLSPLAALAGGTGLVIAPTIDRPGLTGDKSPMKGSSKYKVRDSDGNVVASGGIGGAGEGEDNPQPVTIDLPPGDYTVEVVYDDGETHAEGTSQWGGTAEVTVGGDGPDNPFTEIEVDPMTPEELLDSQIQDSEDTIAEIEDDIEELETDMAEHVVDGEDVGDEHIDMLEELRKRLKKAKKILAYYKKKQEQQRMQRVGNVRGGGAKAALPRVPDGAQGRPMGGKAVPPVPRGKY